MVSFITVFLATFNHLCHRIFVWFHFMGRPTDFRRKRTRQRHKLIQSPNFITFHRKADCVYKVSVETMPTICASFSLSLFFNYMLYSYDTHVFVSSLLCITALITCDIYSRGNITKINTLNTEQKKTRSDLANYLRFWGRHLSTWLSIHTIAVKL